jgi:hypothetical protein
MPGCCQQQTVFVGAFVLTLAYMYALYRVMVLAHAAPQTLSNLVSLKICGIFGL